jgi:hypothetical protein
VVLSGETGCCRTWPGPSSSGSKAHRPVFGSGRMSTRTAHPAGAAGLPLGVCIAVTSGWLICLWRANRWRCACGYAVSSATGGRVRCGRSRSRWRG